MPSYEQYGFPNRPRRHRDSPAPWSVVLPLVLLLVSGGLGLGYFFFRGDKREILDSNAKPRDVTPRGDRDAFEKERIRVFKESNPGRRQACYIS